MTDEHEELARLHDDLRAAIDGDIAGRRTDDLLPDDYWAHEAGRMALRFWAEALMRDLHRLHYLFEASRQRTPPDDPTLPLEEAFWRIDAACEKIRALLVLTLDISPFVLKDDKLFFRLGEGAWEGAQKDLRRLARTDEQVRRLASLYEGLYAATRYRNQVSHSLSAIANTYLAPYVGVYLHPNGMVAAKPYYLTPEGVFVENEDIGAETLLARAAKTAEDAERSLRESVALVAGFIRDHGVLSPGPRIYHVRTTEGWSLSADDPRE